MRAIDFGRVKELVSVRRALELLGWSHVRTEAGWQRGPCPVHGSRGPQSDSFAASVRGWHCHRCGQGGDVLALWAAVHGLDVLAAAADLCRAAGIEEPRPPRVPRKPRQRDAAQGRGPVGGAAGGFPPRTSSSPRSGPPEDTEDAGDGLARGSGGGEIGGPERS